MLKKILKYFSYSIILTGLLLGYLSFFGIETKSFNKLIQETLSKSDDKVKAFDDAWLPSKRFADSNIETSTTMILASFEINPEQAMETLTSTLEVCTHNVESQQYYIDSYRDLVAKGLLKVNDSDS